MKFIDDLLLLMSGYKGPYRLIRKQYALHYADQTRKSEQINEQVFRNTLSRLKKQGLAENKNDIWSITEKGKRQIEYVLHSRISPKTSEGRIKKKSMIVAFDIPEVDRKKRNWLRGGLISLGFIQLQKSVWFGPAPLPEKFIDELHTFRLVPHLKFFRATEENIV